MADIGTTINDYLVYPIGKSQQWLTLKTETDDGGIPLRRKKRQTQWQQFNLTCAFYTQATADAFDTFFNDHGGGAESFAWASPPAQVASAGFTVCVFPRDSFDVTVEGPNYWTVTFTILAYI